MIPVDVIFDLTYLDSPFPNSTEPHNRAGELIRNPAIELPPRRTLADLHEGLPIGGEGNGFARSLGKSDTLREVSYGRKLCMRV